MPFLGLSKLVSLGLTGLGSTGAGIYFTPFLIEGKSFPGQLSNDRGEEINVSTYLESAAELESKLSGLYSKFESVLKNTQSKKETQRKEIETSFQKVAEREEKLESEYKQNEKLIQEMEKILKSLFENNKKKLEVEAALKSFSTYNQLMFQANSYMHEWGSSLKKFICAIDNKGAASDCESKAKEWLKNQGSTQDAEPVALASTSGGGTESSKAALNQLEQSKQALETKLQALATALNKNLIQQLKVTVAEALSTQGKQHYENKATFLTSLSNSLTQNLQTSVATSQETTRELNKSYENLKTNYQKWEIIKSNETVLHRHKSSIQSFLCNDLHPRESTVCPKQLH
ncbi:hypothetical protein [Candidatus Mycoplasma haematominutum]|uniref:Uncharacterized protein n=1 Tax=Candidatus Mycoplasma haematominutum 'Birmingham 1' TaxID=1116213 RepID=G8C3G0_9MOLU|nr:hypothetical protein [Candidatus Mycoplasma haematominutum]CCE66858.1 hypothetical protein MHM_03400 [Candidatus Mycoplasma haematominutum 'Birmingham 1']